MPKKKTDKLDRVPPFMPLFWREWQSSPVVRSMTPSQKGVFIDILLHQWVYGSFPRGAWPLSRALGLHYQIVHRWLTQYSELVACCECGVNWSCGDCECGVSEERGNCENLKLKKHSKTVGFWLSGAQPEPEPIPENQPELEPEPLSSSAEGSGPASATPFGHEEEL